MNEYEEIYEKKFQEILFQRYLKTTKVGVGKDYHCACGHISSFEISGHKMCANTECRAPVFVYKFYEQEYSNEAIALIPASDYEVYIKNFDMQIEENSGRAQFSSSVIAKFDFIKKTVFQIGNEKKVMSRYLDADWFKVIKGHPLEDSFFFLTARKLNIFKITVAVKQKYGLEFTF